MYANGYLSPSTTLTALTERHCTPTLGVQVLYRPLDTLSHSFPVHTSTPAPVISMCSPICTYYPSLEIQRTNGALVLALYLLDVLKNMRQGKHREMLFKHADMRRHPACYVALPWFFAKVGAHQYSISRASFLFDPGHLILG